jgi:hypothetical protein
MADTKSSFRQLALVIAAPAIVGVSIVMRYFLVYLGMDQSASVRAQSIFLILAFLCYVMFATIQAFRRSKHSDVYRR